MPHSGRTSKGPNYRSTPTHPNPAVRGSRATGTTKSAAGRARRPAAAAKPYTSKVPTGTKPYTPRVAATAKPYGSKPMMTGKEMAAERNKMQRGAAMRSPKAAGRGRR